MILKDLRRKDPEQYNSITQSLEVRGIEYNDESEVNDLARELNALNISAAANRVRGMKPAGEVIIHNDDSVFQVMVAAGNKMRK